MSSHCSTIQVDLSTPVDHHHADMSEGRGSIQAPPPPVAAAAALPPTNGIQVKYVENLIKEAHEETV